MTTARTIWDVASALFLLTLYAIALFLSIPLVLFVLWSDRHARRHARRRP